MNNIALPKKIDFIKGDEPNSGKVVIEPCFPGYGITLGNSLRRVLLSSLPGAAVIGVKIEGVDHEFMALPHVKEDMLEIIMNIKNLKLKLHSEEPVKLSLEAHGQKVVTAKDITKDSSVDIINEDLEIANITDMAGNLKIEIYIDNGLGYETVESREEISKEIGYIEVDSIFSPILNVGVKVENARVGKMTNWDKLVIDIVTDGSIEFKDAFKYANNILLDQFTAVKGGGVELDKENEKEEITEEENSEETENTEEKKKRGRPKKED